MKHIRDVSSTSSMPKSTVARQPIPLGDLDPDAVKVVRRLVRYDHLAYLVGGCVRDLLLGHRPKDFDVATSARPPELRRLFRNCRIIGRRFRLAHMIFREGKIIEVATFRREPPPPGEGCSLMLTRDNVFGEPHEDACRRDFTINGLFYDVSRDQVIDYVGGLEDIERRLVRTIGDPDIRLQEDPVRLLRAIKFAARLEIGIAPELYAAALRQRKLLERAAPPRVFEEILRFLRGGAARRSLWLAWEMGVLAEILPELDCWLTTGSERFRRTFRVLQAADHLVRTGPCPSDSVLMTALLSGPLTAAVASRGDRGAAVRDELQYIAERFVMPRKMRDRVRQIVMAQRRLENPARIRSSALPRRDYYSDAVDFFEIVARSRGADDDAVRSWRRKLPRPIVTASQPQPSRRSRRRPRPRRYGTRRR